MKKNLLWMMVAILTYGLAFTSCTNEVDNPTPVVPPVDEIEAQLREMTLREKVGQMFYVPYLRSASTRAFAVS